MAGRLGLLQRLFDRFAMVEPATNGNAKAVGGQTGVTLTVPQVTWFSHDGTRTITELFGGARGESARVDVASAYAAAAYAHAAIRYRASRLAEPPLMVIREDETDGTEEWQPKHVLARLLQKPAPEYRMKELLFRTSISVDRWGHALWLKDANGRGLPGRLTPFSGTEFSIEATRERLRGKYILHTARGDKTVAPEQVVYFHEPNPDSWLVGLSKLEVMLAWLNLSQTARATVRDLLENAVWPSIILQPDHEWNPTPKEFDDYKAQANQYAKAKGGALPMIGGGTATVVSARVRDLIPDEVLDRVESVVSSVFEVPAIILQFLVGMKNSPWSQMEEARRMCTEDTLVPRWNDVQDILTDELLRPLDPEDDTLFVRFDLSRVAALQVDKKVQADIVEKIRQEASLNERRMMVGLEPVDDPRADDIPELVAVAEPEEEEETEEGQDEDEDEPEQGAKGRRSVWAALRAQQAERAIFEWGLEVEGALKEEAGDIADLALEHLPTEGKAERGKAPFLTAVLGYFEGAGKARWRKTLDPLVAKTTRQAVTALAANLGVSFDLLRPGVKDYARREAAWLVKHITETTRDRITTALEEGLQAGEGAAQIAARLKGLPAFDQNRAMLVARTEATRVNNGAPTEALLARQEATGRRFVKRWNTALDDRVRDEHAEMEGEEVALDAAFSNGLDFPSEPNCRCVLTYEEVEA